VNGHFVRSADIERNQGQKKNPNRARSFLVHDRNQQYLNGNTVEEKKICGLEDQTPGDIRTLVF
jgi:hypothetical protein